MKGLKTGLNLEVFAVSCLIWHCIWRLFVSEVSFEFDYDYEESLLDLFIS